MSIGDFVKGVVSDVLNDMLKKATGTTKRRRRRRADRTPAPDREAAQAGEAAD